MSEESEGARTPFYRNPLVIGFLAGIITLTLLRPLLRHEPAPPPVLGQLPAYSLEAADGHPFGSTELAGQVYVANFFFTRCPSICPVIMSGMAKLRDGFASRGIEGIRLVSITVDPEHDRPDDLRDYAGRIGADGKRWVLLTGDPDRVRELVVGGFKTPMDPAVVGNPGPADIAHSGKLVLVDGQGRIRGYYDTDEMGLDEVFNRAQHVLKQEREGR